MQFIVDIVAEFFIWTFGESVGWLFGRKKDQVPKKLSATQAALRITFLVVIAVALLLGSLALSGVKIF